MSSKYYMLLAVLMVISASVLVKNAFVSNQYVGSQHKAMIINGVELTVKVDIYQNARGIQRFEISNPIEIKRSKLAVNK